nr:Ubiquitin and WLM domain-containing protein [Ipomoea batatas]
MKVRNFITLWVYPRKLWNLLSTKTYPVSFLLSPMAAAAMDVLALIGFSEDVLFDETGRTENYLVLKRNDPGLLWLAKSSLETYIA